jgi:HTH-type transcriptional regulator/antitoxin HigA
LVNVIARKNLESFWRHHPETEQPLRAWLVAAKTANWTSKNAVLGTFLKASLVNAERCVFDICGGNYRLIVAFKFSAKVAFIKFIGTHAQYDRVNAVTVAEFQEVCMAIHPIHTEADHDAAVSRIEALWAAQPGTVEHDEIEVLAVLVSVYEDGRWPILPPDPVEAIKFHMEQNNFRQKDLAAVIGSASRVSEVLNRWRPLTVDMIGAIHSAWSIPLESLIGTRNRAA